jgi:hypothetical protein
MLKQIRSKIILLIGISDLWILSSDIVVLNNRNKYGEMGSRTGFFNFNAAEEIFRRKNILLLF